MALTLGADCPTDQTITGLGPAGAPSKQSIDVGQVVASGTVSSSTGLSTTGSAIVGGTVEANVVRITANAAPADATLEAGEAAFWFDKTDGAAKLMVKAKQADGTVKVGSFNVQT